MKSKVNYLWEISRFLFLNNKTAIFISNNLLSVKLGKNIKKFKNLGNKGVRGGNMVGNFSRNIWLKFLKLKDRYAIKPKWQWK